MCTVVDDVKCYRKLKPTITSNMYDYIKTAKVMNFSITAFSREIVIIIFAKVPRGPHTQTVNMLIGVETPHDSVHSAYSSSASSWDLSSSPSWGAITTYYGFSMCAYKIDMTI